MNNLIIALMTVYSFDLFAQDEIRFFTDVLGLKGLLIIVGILFFIFSYKNNIKLFNWIDDQTYGMRDYILKNCDLLLYKIDPQKLTYGLLIYIFAPAILVLGIFLILGKALIGTVLAIVLFVVAWKSPKHIIDFLVARRISKYHLQMVDALNLLSNGLRAGLSVPQSIGMVVDELNGPVSEEFSIVLQQSRIGVPLEEALENLNKRIPLEDNEMFVTSVNILRETGGNLAEVFDTITYIIRERVRLKQKINIYTAQGRMQAMIILSMPTALLLYFISSNSQAVDIYTSLIGMILLLVAYALNILSGFVMFKLIQIKV